MWLWNVYIDSQNFLDKKFVLKTKWEESLRKFKTKCVINGQNIEVRGNKNSRSLLVSVFALY